jgi:hypothetical protein
MAYVKAAKLREQMQKDPERCVRQLREALHDKHLKPEDFSLRDLAEGLMFDRSGNPIGREYVQALNPRRQADSEAMAILEAVDSGAFKNITGQIAYTKIMDAYQSPAFVGASLVPTVPTEFSGEKIPGLTGLGDQAEVVEEGKAYPRAGVSEDWIETPQTTKKGLIVEVTKEAIYFDRTGLVLQRCQKVGESLGLNREKRLIDLVLGVTNNYKWRGTAYDTYQASTPWINVNASNGLENWTDIQDALDMFAAITDPSTGEPIVFVPNTIVCHSSLVPAARYILNATQVKVDPNANAGTAQYQLYVPNNQMIPGNYTVVSSPFIDARYTAGSVTSTTWFFGDFSGAFAYMENWPLAVVPMPPNSYEEWNRDVVAGWKASERGKEAVMEPRKVQQNTA